jgi:hypothetical protein
VLWEEFLKKFDISAAKTLGHKSFLAFTYIIDVYFRPKYKAWTPWTALEVPSLVNSRPAVSRKTNLMFLYTMSISVWVIWISAQWIFDWVRNPDSPSYDAFYSFFRNPIKAKYERYRRLSVGETHPSRRHYTHTQAHRAYISEWVPRNTHRHSISLDITLLLEFNRVSRKGVKRI